MQDWFTFLLIFFSLSPLSSRSVSRAVVFVVLFLHRHLLFLHFFSLWHTMLQSLPPKILFRQSSTLRISMNETTSKCRLWVSVYFAVCVNVVRKIYICTQNGETVARMRSGCDSYSRAPCTWWWRRLQRYTQFSSRLCDMSAQRTQFRMDIWKPNSRLYLIINSNELRDIQKCTLIEHPVWLCCCCCPHHYSVLFFLALALPPPTPLYFAFVLFQ